MQLVEQPALIRERLAEARQRPVRFGGQAPAHDPDRQGQVAALFHERIEGPRLAPHPVAAHDGRHESRRLLPGQLIEPHGDAEVERRQAATRDDEAALLVPGDEFLDLRPIVHIVEHDQHPAARRPRPVRRDQLVRLRRDAAGIETEAAQEPGEDEGDLHRLSLAPPQAREQLPVRVVVAQGVAHVDGEAGLPDASGAEDADRGNPPVLAASVVTEHALGDRDLFGAAGEVRKVRRELRGRGRGRPHAAERCGLGLDGVPGGSLEDDGIVAPQAERSGEGMEGTGARSGDPPGLEVPDGPRRHARQLGERLLTEPRLNPQSP